MEEQKFNFDKFVDDLAKREDADRSRREDLQRDEDNSQNRAHQKKYQEKAGNRIRYRK